ncbi:MAG: type II toxin-antitoxin system prevent-host-death family antitoxin [Verrucomicrobia bacterium]|nr:type II toxin-antitoxin system prevent-host-death family antitoxin [Verrucomicrobiota bacterium]
MSETTMTATKAARNFGKIIRRAELHGTTVVTRKGKPVARIVPAGAQPKTGRELAEIWPKLPHLSPEEAESFAADIATARRTLLPLVSP